MDVYNAIQLSCSTLFLSIVITTNNLGGINFKKEIIKQIKVGQRLMKAQITIEIEIDVIGCVESCLRRKRCKSVNYNEVFKICDLNHKGRGQENTSEEMIDDPSFLYIDVNNMNVDKLQKVLFGRNPCKENEQWFENAVGGTKCVTSDCEEAIQQSHATYNADNGIGLYSKVTYLCNEGYYMQGKSHVGCQDNGTWSPIRFLCLSVCENDWNYFQYSCYTVSKIRDTWWKGKADCEEQGGYLAEIESAEENEFIYELASGYTRVWIGGTDHSSYGNEGEWKWSKSGKILSDPDYTSYTNWKAGQPNGGQIQNCMAMRSRKWVDRRCSTNKYFSICEKDTITNV